MSEILIEHNPSEKRIDSPGQLYCPIWTKEVSKSPRVCDEQERRYIIESNPVITPSCRELASMGKGDFVVYPKGMSWT
jgi:uncharacterized cupin superfamily protein